MRLEAKDVSFRYTARSPWILRNCSLALESGQRLALLAPSGGGKTTLSRLLSGYLSPTEGEVLLDGKPLPQKGCCPVQLISQHPETAVDPRWRMRRVLDEGGPPQPGSLADLGIESAWLDRFPRELSGGELQRFCVARALLSGADFLICDEISTMLDAITQAQIWNVILQRAQSCNLGLLVVTHNRALADRICDSVYHLENQEESDGQ